MPGFAGAYRGRNLRYSPDHRSFGRFIRSDQMRDVTARVAEDIARGVAAVSARDESENRKPGPHMADQWQVRKQAGVIEVAGNVRVRVDVFNPDIAAAAQEFGAGRRRGQRTRVLARVASKFGDFHDHGEGAS